MGAGAFDGGGFIVLTGLAGAGVIVLTGFDGAWLMVLTGLAGRDAETAGAGLADDAALTSPTVIGPGRLGCG